jgi:UDP-N-acetylmuramate dehydrogenase
MMAALKASQGAGDIRDQEPMSKHTSWRVGGPADVYFTPDSLDDLAAYLRELEPRLPIFWLGVGSNLLVRDGGIRGVVIAAAPLLRNLEKSGDHEVSAGSGVPCTQLARQCIRWDLAPAEFFAGIPGSVGGALAMNAGAHGGETWERVKGVRTIDRHGNVHERTPSDYKVGYRSVVGPADEWFIEATLQFDPQAIASKEKLQTLLARRKDTQPLGLPSCGSVFRNPPGDHAARLIEAAGLKGHVIGDAEVSTKHANFIINRGDASANDIEQLIRHVQATVAEAYGVDLVHEVRIVGEELS